MAVNPTLIQFFGASATIAADGLVTFDPTELVSVRTPTGFTPLTGITFNAEQIATALLNRWSEQYDQSVDGEFQVAGPDATLVPVPRDGVEQFAQQYVYYVRILNFIAAKLPNPNVV